MQIALVAVVLLAGMWFTVLKPKSADSSSSAPVAQATTQSSEPVAPGVKGLTSAIDKAKGAAATSDAANAKIQTATGGNATAASTSAPAATAAATAKAKRTTVTKRAAATATARKPGTKAATAKAVAAKPAVTKTATATKTATTAKTTTAAKPAATVDPSARLLAYLARGKTLVILFYGRGADDKAARKAVHQTAQGDPKHVVSAYVPISKVGDYEAITSDVDVLAAPTILVISTKGKATPLTGYVDAAVVRNAVSAARTAAAASTK
jgi:hypothetical protein